MKIDIATRTSMCLLRTAHRLTAIAAAGCVIALASATARGEPPPKVDLSTIRVKDLPARLAALDPGKPDGYFLLAEEVASEATDRPARELARRLYVLTMWLDQPGHPGATGNLGPSACLGLASLTRREQERRWLMAVGQALDARRLRTDESKGRLTFSLPEISEDVALNLATAIGLSRSGDGRLAEQYLRKPGVSEALDAYQNVLDDRGMMGGAQRVRRAVSERQDICPECKGKRIVTRPETTGGAQRARLCPACGGNPGPHLSAEELVTQLRMEGALLRGIHRMWGAQALADAGEPLRDPNPNELPDWYGVDPALCLFRDGAWVAVPGERGAPTEAGKPAPASNAGATLPTGTPTGATKPAEKSPSGG